MTTEEVKDEILACARYGELEELKQLLNQVKEENVTEPTHGWLNLLDQQGSSGMLMSFRKK